jgi:hypothetical protein
VYGTFQLPAPGRNPMAQTVSAPRSVKAGIGFGATSGFMSQYGPEQQMLKVARVATWNLQWQVKGFVAARPETDSKTLVGRFVDGSDVEGIDLKASVVDTAWEVLDQQTRRLLLMNTVALYENWCNELCRTFQLFGAITATNRRRCEDGLQWPDTFNGRPRTGIGSVITILISNGGVSPGMTTIASRVQPIQVNIGYLLAENDYLQDVQGSKERDCAPWCPGHGPTLFGI